MGLLRNSEWGLDISDTSIEIVNVSGSGKSLKINKFNRITFDVGIVDNGLIKNEEKLKEVFKKLIAGIKPKATIPDTVYFGLQEGNMYTLRVDLEGNNKKASKLRISEEVHAMIPLEKNDIVYSSIERTTKAGKEAIVIATSKQHIKQWGAFLKSEGIKNVYFDPEVLAIFRGMFFSAVKKPIMTVDIGARSTSIGIFDSYGLRYSFIVPRAGSHISKTLKNTLKISYDQAVAKKTKVGLSGAKKDSKITASIQKALHPIITEINHALSYYSDNYGIDISEVYLLGGTSSLKGIAPYFKEKLSLPVALATDRVKKQTSTIKKPKGSFSFQLYFGAIGMAMRGMQKKWDKSDPILEYTGHASIKAVDKKKLKGKKEDEIIKKPIKEKPVDLMEKTSVVSTQDKKRKKMEKNGMFGFKDNKVLFLLVLIIGVLLIFSAYMFNRFVVDGKPANDRPSNGSLSLFAYPASFTLSIPVAVDPSAYGDQIVRGRIFKKEVLNKNMYSQVLSSSKEEAMASAISGERLWDKPFNQPEDLSTIIYPTNVQWLVFSETDARRILLTFISSEIPDNTRFVLDSVTYNELTPTDNVNVYQLTTNVRVSADVPIDQSIISIMQEVNDTNAKTSSVTVKAGDSIDLTVRSAPSIDSDAIALAVSGEAYVHLVTENGWVKIQYTDKIVGWLPVSSVIFGGNNTAVDLNKINDNLPKVRVLPNEVGFLNVRSGAGTSFNIVVKASPGDEYIVLDESGGWIQIQIDSDTTGWVSSKYVEDVVVQ